MELAANVLNWMFSIGLFLICDMEIISFCLYLLLTLEYWKVLKKAFGEAAFTGGGFTAGVFSFGVLDDIFFV